MKYDMVDDVRWHDVVLLREVTKTNGHKYSDWLEKSVTVTNPGMGTASSHKSLSNALRKLQASLILDPGNEF